MSDLSFYLNDLAPANAPKRDRLTAQYSEATNLGTIHCSCGQLRHLTMAFRCLYCGKWFCFPCAEAHFGETVTEYRQRKRTEWRGLLQQARDAAHRAVAGGHTFAVSDHAPSTIGCDPKADPLTAISFAPEDTE